MKLYQLTEPETAATVGLLTTRLPHDADRIARGALLLPTLTYESCAERNAFWQRHGLPFVVNADPGWTIPSTPDERRGGDADNATPRTYEIRPHAKAGLCQCWAHIIHGGNCRHVYAVLLYRQIIVAKLEVMANAHAVDLRPAGRYPHCYDLCDAWGRTVAGVQYAPRADRWVFDDDAGLARFAAWLTTDEAASEIVRPRAREEYA